MSHKRKLSATKVPHHTYTTELKVHFPDLNISGEPFAEGGGGKLFRIVHDNGQEMPMIAKISNANSKDHQWREMRRMLSDRMIGPHLFRMFVVQRSASRDRTVQILAEWDMDLQEYYRLYRRALPDYIVDKLRQQLRRLHALALVHGDIKTTNILVNVNKSGFVSDITLTDFDFTREDGEDIDEYCDAKEYYDYVDRLLKSKDNKQLLDTQLDEKMLNFAINNH